MFLFFRILLLFTVTLTFEMTLSHASTKDTTTILLFGDSIIAGYGLAENEAVPAQLEKELLENDKPIKVIGAGVSGDTTGAGRGRLDWTLKKYQPDIVILALGGNDVLRGIPVNVTKENIDAMMQSLKSLNLKIILSAVQAPNNLGSDYRDNFNAIYTDMSKKYDAPLYPFLISDTFGKKNLMLPDGIHPNAEGSKLIAKNLAKYLSENILAE